MVESYLLRLTRFLGLFFASPAGVVDAGGGDPGGGEPGGGVPGEGGGEGGEEGVEPTEGEEPAEDEEGAEGGDESAEGEEPEEGAQPTTGKPLEAKFKKALAELKKIDAASADLVRRAYYGEQDFKQVFPNVHAAREARDTLETVGGAEGIERLNSEANNYARELTMMANGDPTIVEDLAHDFPLGLAKLTPIALNRLAQLANDREFLETLDRPTALKLADSYERTMAPHFANFLQTRNVAHSILRLSEFIADGKQNEAYDMAQKLQEWVRGVEAFAKQKFEDYPDTKVSQREQELNAREGRIFNNQVAHTVLDAMNTAINKQLAGYLKTHKLNPEQRKDLVNSIRGHLAEGFQGNKGYQTRMQALLGEKDHNGIRRYVSGQLTADRIKKSVDAVWSLRGFQSTGKKKPAGATGGAAGGGSNGATVRVAQKPSADQIDWSKDRGKIRFMRGEATLKSGKVVRWAW